MITPRLPPGARVLQEPMTPWSNPLRPRSIRGQLILLVTALALPLVALQISLGVQQARHAEDAADAEALVLADATATSVRQTLAVTREMLLRLADMSGQRLIESGECGAVVQIPEFLPHVVNMLVLRRDGSIVCATASPDVGAPSPDWHWLPGLVESRRFAIGEPVLGSLSDTWILPLAAPILDDEGEVLGAVVASMRLVEFQPFLDGVEIDPDQIVTVATADGTVLARSADAERYIGERLPPSSPELETEISPGRFAARGEDLEGVARVWGQVEMDNGWMVYVGLPAGKVLAPARADLGRNVAATLAFVLLGILLAGTLYRRIGRSLGELATGTRPEGDAPIPLPDGTPDEVRDVVTGFNETLRRQRAAEASERAARERFQSIFDNAVFGIYISTVDGRFLTVNPALASMLRYDSPAALMDAGPAILYGDPRVRAELIGKAQEQGRVDAWEVEWMRADDSPITVRLSGRLVEVDGESAFEMIVQDITEEKRREAELRQTQKMEAIGKLAGGIAHDFNNLLTVIAGNLELMEDSLDEGDPLREDVDQIREATQRAGTLTSQVLSFARTEGDGARPVSVNEVLSNMQGLLGRLIGEDVRLDARLAPDPSLILIDPSELEQVVMNLVLNARDAMPTGGEIVIETRPASITAESGEPAEGVVLAVRDTGIGMDRETSKRIFEPFYTTKPVGQGTGLGLSTVYGIVHRADGQIGVESEPGRGTSVQVWFPLAHGELPVKEQEGVTGPRAGGTERILVVEDEELVRMFVRRALSEAGYDVTVAADGQEALEMFEAGTVDVDLLLTDVVMPRLKGPDLADRVAEIAPGLPVLFMSGYVHSDALSSRLGEEPEILLRKPFSTTELCQRVRIALDRPVPERAGA